jgi:hypothetical protein
VLCAPGSPWHRWRLPCIEHTRVASAAPCARSSYRTAWRCPPSLTSPLHLVPRHPFQASSPVGQRSWRYYPTLLTNSISSHFCATRESHKLGSSLLFLGSKFRQTPCTGLEGRSAPRARARERRGRGAEAMGGKAKPTKHTAKELARKVCCPASGRRWHESPNPKIFALESKQLLSV